MMKRLLKALRLAAPVVEATELRKFEPLHQEANTKAVAHPNADPLPNELPLTRSEAAEMFRSIAQKFVPCLSGCHTRPPDIVARDFAA